MAVSIQELIEKRDEIKARKQAKVTMQTSIGEIICKKPSSTLLTEAMNLDDGGDIYLLYNSIIEPNVKDKSLQEAFNCGEPTDIIKALFEVSEVPAISGALLKSTGFGKDVHAKVYDEVKN